MILGQYNGCSEKDIRAMPYEDLVNAVIKMFSVQEIKCEEWRGAGLLPDDLADAFRGRSL